MAPSAQRSRIAIDLTREVRRRARIAAARHDMTLQEYVRKALERQLAEDSGDTLLAVEDPVLEELWGDPENAVYDRL